MCDSLFKLAFQEYGEPWRIPDENSADAQTVSTLLRAFRNSIKVQRRAVASRGPIYCDLIDNPSFNAMATVYDEHEFVTLFVGAINLIYTACFEMLSDPESLTSLGDASGESVAEGALASLRAGVGRYRPNHLPKDAQRAQAARDFALLTCLFILLHEVGHIIGGHPAFLQRQGIAVYEEIPWSNISEEQSKIHVAFEWEADGFAAGTSYQTTRMILESPAGLPALTPLHPDFVWGITSAMTFALVAYFGGGLRMSSPTHPCALHRYIWSTLTVGNTHECKRFSPDEDTLRRGFSEVANWFQRHDLKLADGSALGVQGTTDLERIYAEYLRVRETLRNESRLLDQIETRRRLGGEAWRKNNRID